MTLARDDQAKVEVAAHEMGVGTATAQTQVAAERLGMPMDKVMFCLGDSRFSGVVFAGGSQQSAAIGSAVRAAQLELFAERLKPCGNESPLDGCSPATATGMIEAKTAPLARPNSALTSDDWLVPGDAAVERSLVLELTAADLRFFYLFSGMGSRLSPAYHRRRPKCHKGTASMARQERRLSIDTRRRHLTICGEIVAILSTSHSRFVSPIHLLLRPVVRKHRAALRLCRLQDFTGVTALRIFLNTAEEPPAHALRPSCGDRDVRS